MGFQATLQFVSDCFTSMSNCDYNIGRVRVMPMPFWWNFLSWVLVKRLNIELLVMGVRYIAVSAASTVLSFVLLQFWTELSLDNLKSDGLIAENYIHSENVTRVIELLSGSYATIGLLTNFVLNVFVLVVLFLKVSQLNKNKLMIERNYIFICKMYRLFFWVD